jgi:hypothetical protein
MQLNPQLLETASRRLRRFRIGGAIIAMVPLIFSFIHLLYGNGSAQSAPFGVMSAVLVVLVVWMCDCAERFIKDIQVEMMIASERASKNA